MPDSGVAYPSPFSTAPARPCALPTLARRAAHHSQGHSVARNLACHADTTVPICPTACMLALPSPPRPITPGAAPGSLRLASLFLNSASVCSFATLACPVSFRIFIVTLRNLFVFFTSLLSRSRCSSFLGADSTSKFSFTTSAASTRGTLTPGFDAENTSFAGLGCSALLITGRVVDVSVSTWCGSGKVS